VIPATIMVMAKEPRPGRAKTRLTPPCTPDEAAVLAAAALHDTFTTIARVPARRRIAVLDGRPGPWFRAGFEVLPQGSGSLGDRLADAFARADGPTFLVGMDTPQLTVRMVVEALDELLEDGTDAVLGHAPDGGWWAIGLRRPDAKVFDGIPMSTTETGARQLARLHTLGLRTRLLRELRDVDHFADARAVAAVMPPTSHFARAVDRVTHAIERRVPEAAT
jgi:rSAM/selenodomain-associated transferase 1